MQQTSKQRQKNRETNRGDRQNIARIAKLPYGQRKPLLKERLYWKEGFIERLDLLKERLYCRKGLNCPGLYKLAALSALSESSALSALSDSLHCPHCLYCLYCLFYLYCPHCLHHLHGLVIEIWMKLWNLVEIAKFGWNCEIESKLWN